MTDFVASPSNHRWTDATPTWPERPAWQALAACNAIGPSLFFSEVQGENVGDAKKVCADCPVRDDCLDYALANNERSGVWGGLSPKERSRVRRARGQAARPAHSARWQRAQRQATAMRDAGQSIAEIARTLGVDPRTVHRWLESEAS